MEPYSGDTNVIAKVGTTPEDRGLVTEDFKAKFDEGLAAFVQWFNTTHKTEFEAHLAENANKHIHSSGNNENGYWIKFDDGTQICRHIIKFIDLPITQAWGSGFIGSAYGLNYYPSAFTAPPSVTTTVVGNDGALVLSVENHLDRLGAINLFRAVSVTADINLSYIAIGRWK